MSKDQDIIPIFIGAHANEQNFNHNNNYKIKVGDLVKAYDDGVFKVLEIDKAPVGPIGRMTDVVSLYLVYDKYGNKVPIDSDIERHHICDLTWCIPFTKEEIAKSLNAVLSQLSSIACDFNCELVERHSCKKCGEKLDLVHVVFKDIFTYPSDALNKLDVKKTKKKEKK